MPSPSFPTLPPSISTDQVAAFVELTRQGSIRAASVTLRITEQGLRNRLVALEERLGAQLYRKGRGPRRSTPLTEQGRRFLPHALAFLDRARELADALAEEPGEQVVRVYASQYLVIYVLIPVVKRFQQEVPEIYVRLSISNEEEIERALRRDPEISFGVAAPYEASPELEYTELFAMDWSLITPAGHALARRRRVGLAELVGEPLILFERGSTGRSHILDAFHEQDLTPRVAMEATNTETIVRMVEGGLGVSIVPLLPSGAVTRGRKVEVRRLEARIRPIHSGILVRRGDRLSAASGRFLDYVKRLGKPVGSRSRPGEGKHRAAIERL